MSFIRSGGDPAYFNRYAYTAKNSINTYDPDGEVFTDNVFTNAAENLGEVLNEVEDATQTNKKGRKKQGREITEGKRSNGKWKQKSKPKP